MRTSATSILRATALTWLVLALMPALAAASAAQVPERLAMAQGADEEEDGQPTSAAEPETAEEPTGPLATPPRLGASRRLDPFDANDERPAKAPAAAGPDSNTVVCMAGCDGPRGEVVYRKTKRPSG
jgi:hypothetical protein